MDNSKKNIHNSGPLGMLIKNGQIKNIDSSKNIDSKNLITASSKDLERRFQTQSGIEFNENELTFVDPTTCEPWQYANRLEEDMGNIHELAASINENKQLQPALIRPHPHPHDKIEYEVIFGRRRHKACLQLKIPFLVIKKNIPTTQEAISFQEAENRERKNVSNYSNAVLYSRLLQDKVFKNEKEIADKIGISLSKLYDILAYSKMPSKIVELIPNMHTLSNNLALKIVSLLKQHPEKIKNMFLIAPEIGRTITSPTSLELKFLEGDRKQSGRFVEKPRIYKSNIGTKLFTLKTNQRGTVCFELNKKTLPFLNHDELCEMVRDYLNNQEEKNMKELCGEEKSVS